jgi:hypothetical protein
MEGNWVGYGGLHIGRLGTMIIVAQLYWISFRIIVSPSITPTIIVFVSLCQGATCLYECFKFLEEVV